MQSEKRLRDLGVRIGSFEPGPLNAITDVPGVAVGHSTIHSPRGATPILRTGVTAILPRDGDIFHERLPAGHFVLNGAGELSGIIQVAEWGLLETPILLTNTMSVGAVGAAVVEHMQRSNPGIGREHDVIIPVVGECDDSFLNDVSAPCIERHHVWEAIDSARGGPVAEGSVGAGTGMITCDLKAGIGTSSRSVPFQDEPWNLGVLVLSNVGRLEDLRLDGVPVGRVISPTVSAAERRRTLYGSIVVVIATDAPVSAKQLDRVCKRAALGIGRVGSYAAHGSGEIVIGFSTANTHPRTSDKPHMITTIADTVLDPLYAATIECTEEAIWNALCAAEEVQGRDGNSAPQAPMERFAEIWRKREALLKRC